MGGAEIATTSPAEPEENYQSHDKVEPIKDNRRIMIIPTTGHRGMRTESFDFELGSEIDTILPGGGSQGMHNDSRLGIELESR